MMRLWLGFTYTMDFTFYHSPIIQDVYDGQC
jgi:hypothetical protein